MAEGRDRSSPPSGKRRAMRAAAGLVSLSLAGGLLAACAAPPSGGGSSAVASSGPTSVASGSPEPAKQDVVFGFSHPYGEVPVVQVVRNGMKKYGEEEGWKVLIDSTQGGDLQDQLATLDTWITQGVTAINVFPVQPSSYVGVAQRAVDAGIIWTTYFSYMEIGAGGVGLPASLSGEVTGKATVDWIKANDPDAEVLILTAPDLVELQDRVEIPKKMIEEQTNATIVAEQAAVDQATGLQVTEAVLQAHPNVSVVVGFNDDAALGAAEAFRKSGKLGPSEVWIIGQDGALDALEAVRDPNNYYKATAAIDGSIFYQTLVAVTKRAIENDWQPGDPQERIDLPPILITAENSEEADRLLTMYEELGIQ